MRVVLVSYRNNGYEDQKEKIYEIIARMHLKLVVICNLSLE